MRLTRKEKERLIVVFVILVILIALSLNLDHEEQIQQLEQPNTPTIQINGIIKDVLCIEFVFLSSDPLDPGDSVSLYANPPLAGFDGIGVSNVGNVAQLSRQLCLNRTEYSTVFEWIESGHWTYRVVVESGMAGIQSVLPMVYHHPFSRWSNRKQQA